MKLEDGFHKTIAMKCSVQQYRDFDKSGIDTSGVFNLHEREYLTVSRCRDEKGGIVVLKNSLDFLRSMDSVLIIKEWNAELFRLLCVWKNKKVNIECKESITNYDYFIFNLLKNYQFEILVNEKKDSNTELKQKPYIYNWNTEFFKAYINNSKTPDVDFKKAKWTDEVSEIPKYVSIKECTCGFKELRDGRKIQINHCNVKELRERIVELKLKLSYMQCSYNDNYLSTSNQNQKDMLHDIVLLQNTINTLEIKNKHT